MRTINIAGRELQYQTKWDMDEVGEWCWTEFYEGTIEVTRRGFPKFWIKRTVTEPKLIFQINGANTEDPRLLKSWWEEKILKELEILDRSAQIERGELI
jgi:hypothetical protein